MSKQQLIVCYAFLMAGLMIALCSVGHRIAADSAYREMIVLVDWHALAALPDHRPGAKLSASNNDNETASETPWELLAKIPGAQLCYGEETIGTLTDQGIIRPAWVTTGAPAFAVMDERHLDSIRMGLLRHGYLWEQSADTDGRLVFQVPDLPEDDLALLPVAWLESVIADAEERGVDIVLRPGGSEFTGKDGLRYTLDYCADQPLMLFQGPTVLGYPASLRTVVDVIKDNDQSFGWVEFDEQDGGGTLASLLAPDVVRVHSIPPEEMVNYFGAKAVTRYLRAVRERNIRCLYVRPFVRGSVLSGMDAVSTYRTKLYNYNDTFFAMLARGLADEGFQVVNDVTPPKDASPWLKTLRPFTTTLAVGAVATLLLAMWLTAWPRWVWSLFIALTVIKAVAAMAVPIVSSAVLFAAALVFPLWGIWWAVTIYLRLAHKLQCSANCPRRIFIAMLALMIASLATIAGGLMIHGGMWDANTMLKIGQFRGVTLSLALPVLLFAAYAWKAETLQDAFDTATLRLMDYWRRFMQLWQAPIRYGDIAFIMIALGAVGIVLLRSGNESPLEVLSVETWFRGSLEQWFTVRPRTKELIGHPLLIVFLISLAWRSRLALLFGIGGLLGQVSILNTFCHLHTPLMTTVTRVLLGLGLGLISGLVWGVVIVVVNHVWQKGKEKVTGNEDVGAPPAAPNQGKRE